jgi:hypothetical protein
VCWPLFYKVQLLPDPLVQGISRLGLGDSVQGGHLS